MAEQIDSWPISTRTKNALINSNIFSLSDLPEFLDDLKEISGLGAQGVKEIREWCSAKFNRVFKNKPKPKKKVLQDYSGARKIVQHFLGSKTDWAKQLKIADALVAKYGVDTLLLVDPNPKVYSLVWYNTSYGDDYIRKYMPKKIVKKEEEPVEEVDNSPCDLEIEFVKKPSIRDFLK